MSNTFDVTIPDLGDAAEVEVVEVLVKPGDRVEVDDGLVTLESEKASMDVPSPRSGIVRRIGVEVGGKVTTGALVVTLEVEAAGTETAAETSPSEPVRETESAGAAEVEEDADAPSDSPSAPEPIEAGAEGDLHAEILVLGAGPGGYTAAFRAADLGKQVVLVDEYPSLGGVCLNIGCIPSKALLHVARVVDEVEHLSKHGVILGKPEFDLDTLREWKDWVVGRLTGGLDTLATKRKVRVVQGVGKFASSRRLEVQGETGTTTISFDQAILAVGSRVVRLPDFPWEDPRVIDSTGALELADVPPRMLLVGGGIIGLEMAMVYGALGSKITIVELMDGLIPGCDRDLVRPLERRLKNKLGAAVYLQTRVTRIAPGEEGLTAYFDGEKAPDSEVFDKVLVAVGRRPNGDRVGAEAAGVEVDERGFIAVDREQRTNVPHIFAVGDVAGNPMLAHKATHEAKVAAEVAAGHKSSFDARVIPSVAYTDPEVAWVGLTETEAKEQGIVYGKGSFPWAASGRSLGMGRDDGLTKILFDPETDRILGAGIVGTNAGDLIAELTLAIEMDCEAADLALTIHPHPTLSETIGFAAESYEGTLTDLYTPPRKRRK